MSLAAVAGDPRESNRRRPGRDHGVVPDPVAVERLVEAGHAGGLDAVGVAAADPFDDTRHHLEERKAAGLHGGMHFTYGHPERATTPERLLPGARALVVGALGYRRADPPPPGPGPAGRVARYAWRDQYAELRSGLQRVADVLDAGGWRTRVVADENGLVDRAAAHRAGLGWYGKNANLLLPGRGSWFVLGSVVTDAPLPAATAPVPDACGACRRCLDACPTGAIVSPGVVDARRCLAWLVQAPGTFPREFREALGDRIYGCDDCQEVCPPNRVAVRRSEPPPSASGDEAWVPLLELLAADDDELLRRHGRWYVPRRQPRYLRRNALVALGNVGDGTEPGVERALDQALRHPDPLLRAHAAWAARRLGRDDLIARHLAGDRAPEVLAELA